MKLRLAVGQLDEIIAQARAAYPAEACGLLVGTGRHSLTVTRVVPAANLLADQPGRFELDPIVRLVAEKQCRATKERVIGHWHSHPDGRAVPSATDLEMAYETNLIWLIVATSVTGPTIIKAFHPNPTSTAFVPVALALQNNACIPPPIPT
jgi:proteasome lid subunit RPN8/RPN11